MNRKEFEDSYLNKLVVVSVQTPYVSFAVIGTLTKPVVNTGYYEKHPRNINVFYSVKISSKSETPLFCKSHVIAIRRL